MSLRRLTLLGATGTVGRNTLDVVARHPERIEVFALTARRDHARLFDQCQQFRPRVAVLLEADAAQTLRERLASAGVETEVWVGPQALAEVAAASEVDLVMSAIVGAAGLLPTLAAVAAAKQVMIANKEPLVMAGSLLMRTAARSGAEIIPIDSEHNAIFQCLPDRYRCGTAPQGVRKLVLTASGGPFREWTIEQLGRATAEQAVRHPNWVMGQKISVDSASLMNKGLELIEAATLYGLPETQVDIVIHPESTIHSLVEYVDGSMLAQIGQPDMRVPIAHALAWPERWESGVEGVDLAALARLRFEAPDPVRFPCLRLAREVLRAGGSAANCLNAANEIAVEAFLAGQLGFLGIPAMIEDCLQASVVGCKASGDDLDSVLAIDAWARHWCREQLGRQALRP